MKHFSIILQGGRSEQQDAVGIFDGPDNRVFAIVADGVGGQSGGAVASATCRMVADKWWQHHKGMPANPGQFLREYFGHAHNQINEQAKKTGLRPRAALAAVLISGDRAWLAHSGDTRIYVLRGREIVHRSLDHSVVQMLLDRGKITEDEMGSHPDKSRLLQCVGGEEFAEPEIKEFPLQSADRILLCSDGLWERHQRGDIALAMAHGDEHTLQQLADEAVARGHGESDNVSLVLLNSTGSASKLPFPASWLVGLALLLAVPAAAWFTVPSLREKFLPKEQKAMAVVVPNPPAQPTRTQSLDEPPAQTEKPVTKAVIPPLAPHPLPGALPPAKNEKDPIPLPGTNPAPGPKMDQNPPPAPKRRTRGFDKKKGFANSLGMEMLYAGTPNGYMSKQETRASDYQAFMAEQPDKAGQHTFADPKHPAHGISFAEAQAFCHWLTERERTSEMIGTEDAYDVPTDVEWTTAAMWPEKDKGMVYPWRGTRWPPTVMVGNFADESAKGPIPATIPGYTDGFLGPAPVGSFAVPSPFGLDDLAGNVAEWSVLPGIDGPPGLRGGGWTDSDPKVFRSENIVSIPDGAARIDSGFRCVLRVAPATPEAEQIAPAIVTGGSPSAAGSLEGLKKTNPDKRSEPELPTKTPTEGASAPKETMPLPVPPPRPVVVETPPPPTTAPVPESQGKKNGKPVSQTPFNRLSPEQQEAQIDNAINNYFYGFNTNSNGALAEALTPTVIISGVDQTTGRPTANGLAAKDFIRHITEWLNKQGKPPQMITQPGAWKIIHRGNDNTIRVQLNFDVADLGKTMPTLHWSQTMIFDATSGKISGIADLVEAK